MVKEGANIMNYGIGQTGQYYDQYISEKTYPITDITPKQPTTSADKEFMTQCLSEAGFNCCDGCGKGKSNK